MNEADKIKSLIEQYLNFFRKKNRNSDELLPLLAENFTFSGPLGEFSSRAGFLTDISRDALSIMDIKILQLLVEENTASALYELHSSDPAVKQLKVSEWYEVQDNKINSIYSVYDATQVKDNFIKI